MGGKTKQSQRTKNNARPSSSGRSALLLNNVNLESGVMNIQGTELPALFPSLAAPNIDPLVSPELQLCIKKLNKKDPITKTKALQELSEVVSNSKVDDVVAALPSWAHFYKALTMDPDRKVREAVQSCHGAMMGACGRRAAPHLRQLVPTWLQAQYDEHAPAQALAQHSLAKTFPDSKLPEVISFCKSEVMAHLLDNLIGECEAGRVAKTDSPEEAAARAASGALRGLQQLAAGLPPAHHAWLRAALDPLLQHAGFWRRAEHKHPRVRAAWYAAVGQIIQRFGAEYAGSYGRKTLRILVGIEETNPLAAAQFWDCLLLFMFNVEEWHQYVDRKELLVKRILDVLENGGWGDARHLSNMLLPLLAHMPPDMLGKEFYISFFNAIFNGLDKKSILSSKSERQSWITTLDECLRYLSIQQQVYILEIVTSVHRTWLENILSDKHDGPVRTNLIKYSASSMAALVKYWLKQAKETNCEKYDQMIRNFWQNVGSTITTHIDKLSNDHAEIGKSIDGHILLLQTFKTSLTQDAKRLQSIKFDGDSPNVVEKPQKVTPPCDASVVERYNHNLFEVVETICGHYFGLASTREISSPVLAPIITLLVDFDSSKLYTAIARQFDCDSAYKLYDKVFRSWLAGDTMRCKAVVDIIFLLMKYLSEEEQDALFDSFKQFPPAVVETCLSRCVSHPHWARAAARRWARGPLAAAALRALCARVAEYGDVAARDLLLLCLSHDAAGELMVSRAAARAVVERVAAALGAAAGPHVELLGGLGARLAAALTEPALVLGLFRLSVQVPRGSGVLSEETWCEVRAAWQDGLLALGEAPRRLLLMQAAAAVHQHLRLHSDLSGEPDPLPPAPPADEDTEDTEAEAARMEHVVALCPYLVRAREEAAALSRRVLALRAAGARAVPPHALRQLQVRGALSCPLDAPPEGPELAERDVRAYTARCIFRATYLRAVLLHRLDEDLADTWCDHLLADDFFVDEYCELYRDYMVLLALAESYAFWAHYKLVERSKDKLLELLRDVDAECGTAARARVLGGLARRAAAGGGLWAFAAKYYEVHVAPAGGRHPGEADGSPATTENNQENTETSQEKTDSNQEKTDTILEKTDGVLEKTDIHEKMDGVLEKKDIIQEKMDSDLEKTDIIQEQMDTVQEKTDTIQGKTDSVQEKTDIIQEQTNTVQEKTDTIQEKTDIHEKMDGVLEKKDIIQEKMDTVQEKTDTIQGKTDSVQEKTDIIQEQTNTVQEKTDTIQEKTDGVQEKTDNVQEKTNGTQEKTDGVQEKSDADDDDYKWDDLEGLDFDNINDIITGNGFFHTLQAAQRWAGGGARALRTAYLVMVRALLAAHAREPHVAAGALLRDALAARARCGPDVLINLYYAHEHVMLYDRDVAGCAWGAAAGAAAAARYLAALVDERGWDLPPHHWDFATISACHLLASAAKSAHAWGNTEVAMLTCAALTLYERVERFIAAVPRESLTRRPSAHVAHLPAEWRDIFAPDLQGSLFSLLMSVLESSAETEPTASQAAVLGALARCARSAAWALLPAARRAELPPGAVARAAAAALHSARHHAAQYLACELLRRMLEPLVLEDAEKLAEWSAAAAAQGEGGGGAERAPPQLSLSYYDDAYFRLRDLVTTALAHVRVCAETCSLVEFTDVHRLALGWLLLADCMARQSRLARGDLAHHYCELYRERKYTEPLLTAALCLLPADVFARAQEGAPPLQHHLDMFQDMPPLDVDQYCSALTVGAAACRGVALCACGAGASDTRGWRGAVPYKHARLLDTIVREYISPGAVRDEIMAVLSKPAGLEDTEISVQWSCGEVTCLLTVEDRPLELRVRLSRTHPQGAPRVLAPDVPHAGTAHWLLMYMAHQNGSLLNALRMWVSSVTQTLERAAQCYICYCRLHFQSGELPAVLCHQCRNKFHTECLRNWFVSSNKSNCPLCRTAF